MTVYKYSTTAAGVAVLLFAGTAHAASFNDQFLNIDSRGDGQVQGTIVSISGSSITINGWGGPWSIDASDANFQPISEVSKFLSSHSTTGYVSDLQNGDIHVGDQVNVSGGFTTSGPSIGVPSLGNKIINDQSLREREVGIMRLTGVVSNPNASAGTFTLTGASASYTITVPTTAIALVAGVKSSVSTFFASLPSGSTATVIGAPTGTNVTALLASVGTYNYVAPSSPTVKSPPAPPAAPTNPADNRILPMVTIDPTGQGIIQGTVTGISGTSLTVKSWGGKWTADVSNARFEGWPITDFMSLHSTTGSASAVQDGDIQVGDGVEINGQFSTTGTSVAVNQSKHGGVVSPLDARQTARKIEGIVSNPNASARTFNITVLTKTYTISISPNTIALVNGVQSSASTFFANLTAGGTATAFGTPAGTNVAALLVSVGRYTFISNVSVSKPTTGTSQTTTTSAPTTETTTTSTTNASTVTTNSSSNSTTQTTSNTTSASCAFNGGTVASGQSTTAYQSSFVSDESQCVSQIRICTNGTLSGSYAYASCTALASTADQSQSGQSTLSTALGINALLAKITDIQAKIAALQQGVAIQATTASSGVSCPVLSSTLSYGSRGAGVILAQQYLISQNLLAAGNDTGYFGPLTQAAVMQWQSAHGIDPVGIIGPITRAAFAACN